MTKKLKLSRTEICRKAGRVRSAAKTAAVRKNGRLGGRPANPAIQRIMQERGVSRQRAHKILQARQNHAA